MSATDRSTLRRGLGVLAVAVREEPWIFGAALLASALYGVAPVATSWTLGRITEDVVLPAFAEGRTTAGALVGAGLAVFAVAMLRVVGVIGRRVGAGIMQFRLQATYRRKVAHRYLRLPLAWHQRHPAGQLLSNVNADVEAAWAPIVPLPTAIGVVVMLAAAIVSMFAVDPVLAAVALLVFPAIGLLNVFYQRRLTPLAAHAQGLRAETSDIAHESFDGALVVKTLGLEEHETARMAAVAARLRDANVAVGRTRGRFDPMLDALPNLGILSVLAVGTARLSAGALTVGELVQVSYLFTMIAFPVRAFGWVLAELPRSSVGWARVRHVLDAEGDLPTGELRLSDAGPISLDTRGVSYAYDGGTVLHDVTLAVGPGRTVAVVGPTGSGKSTLATLMVRLVDPVSGDVLMDGLDARRMRSGEVSSAVAFVPQETLLFDDTVRGNVLLGLELPDERVWDALEAVQVADVVRALPDGLDTRVGERGATLSGGQRQRIALARALVRRPRLLVLDDATSSIDPEVEGRILRRLRDARVPSTLVLVAYRQATIALADHVVYVERGRVVDSGTPDELRARCPGYRDLVTAYEREEQGQEQTQGQGRHTDGRTA
ncbi:ABC transporter ATP-binding protein [Streptomyces sp. DH12]|uniref:ABC transporter ATP-binding protein n=1 Tax=Streptomyces sp. DH12 TaxID=2857010 RepID=UPI001E37A592|nr:ABC transporter ATP-binding protein [Streptomyces sp. DH12]